MASFPPNSHEDEHIPRLLSAEGRLNVYPNPVRTSAKIEYALSGPGPVWMGVLDANGRLLQVLQNAEWEEAGSHFLDWMPTEGNSGLFFLILKTAEGVVSKKMVLIK